MLLGACFSAYLLLEIGPSETIFTRSLDYCHIIREIGVGNLQVAA